jgi:hypothetical protein
MSGIFDQVINYAPPSLLKGTVTYKGTWSAATNTPTLINPPDSTTNGHYYVVSAAGTQFSLSFNIGDWIISNGSAWEKVDNTDAVSSVFGRTGAVVGVSTDYSSVGITNTALGASNPSTVAATTVTATSTIAATGAVTGSNLSGTNTGDQTITLTGGVTGSGTGSFAATVVTNANLTGVITSVGNATSIASQTGTGTKFVVDTSPVLVTPNIGIATGTSLAAALNGTLGATTPSTVAATTLSATGVTSLSGAARITGSPGSLGNGTGLELAYTGNNGYVTSYDRTNNIYYPLTISATTTQITSSGSGVGSFSSTGLAVTGTLTTTGTATFGTTAVGGNPILANYNGTYGINLRNVDNTSGTQYIQFVEGGGGQIGGVARVTTTNAVVFNTTSDARLKENLRDFTDSGRLIDALKPRVFDWKDSDSNGKNVIGFIAQEEHAADPIFAHIGAVSVGDDNPTTITKQWQRSDAALIPILVAELQSLRKRLAALESK